MTLDVAQAFIILVLGIGVLTLCSDRAVDSSVRIALRLGVSPLMTGLVLVSLGTDFPEIVNSIVACAAGHANVALGDALGSVLAQITLVLGLLPILGRQFVVKPQEILVIGISVVLALVFSISMAEKGYFTRINAIFLVASWPAFMFLARSAIGGSAEPGHPAKEDGTGSLILHFLAAIFSFLGVAIGSYAVIQSVLKLAEAFRVSEYLVSFFAVAIGTSLPEFVVDIAAIRRGQFELAIGDILGSCLVDATVAVGIGHILFPQRVSGELALVTGLYAAFASSVVIIVLAARKKLDRKAGVLFLVVYLLSYALLGF
ncbi:MAG: hypothetical protein A2Y73_07090 [Chloroflexi bacterium RBG_13_56_8]|nr:MAG: hypothetical protein A2Y73_07090 [Chloroflexi bacterium RBG_13_56_8]